MSVSRRFLTAEMSFEDIDDWFKIGVAKPSRPAAIERSGTSGVGLRTERYEESLRSSRSKQGVLRNRPAARPGTSQKAYVEHYQKEWEKEQLQDDPSAKTDPTRDTPLPSSALSDLESMSVISGSRPVLPNEISPEQAVQAYENYNFDHTYNKDLPITKCKDQIINTIESNQVTIVQGTTGCGKTTQVPQYILDDYVSRGKHCNIVVTQPRKIAAISIARRVCEERRWQLGSLVGYRVGMDKCTSQDTRLCYMTTGVLLQKLINTRNINEFTHVILDEVHERDQDTDFAMLVVRKLQRTNSRHIKVILMSATFDTTLFGQYFALPVRGSLEMLPVVNIEGKIFEVAEYYLGDVTKFGVVPPHQPQQPPSIVKEAYTLGKNLINHFDDIERVEQGLPAHSEVKKRGTVLVFLPGIAEIEEFEKLLLGQDTRRRLVVIPLHSSITTQEQARAFTKPEEGFRKVILSTNIAESSITVPDIKYVIDFMLTKCMVCDVETNYQSLQLNWASKANAEQRKGRAGRVSSGRVYRLVHRAFYEDYIDDFAIPEMQRCPLEQLILQVKVLDLGEPKAILALALEPPNLDNIERTVLLLKEVGALTTLRSGVINPHDGDLTFVGKVLASLPVDIRVGKLLVLGHVFGCLKECLIIGAGLSLKSFFSQPLKKALQAYQSKLRWDGGAFSDSVAIMHAYKEWEACKNSGLFARGRWEERKWAENNMIQLNPLREVSKLVDELEGRLHNFNIQLPRGNPRNQLRRDTTHDLLILKLVLAGAFYPNYFTWAPSDEAESLKMLSGKDPCTTVMVKNVPPHGQLYVANLAKLFKDCGRGKRIYFEDTKAFIEFEREGETSSILPAVYAAVKMRFLKERLELDVYEVEKHTIQQEMNMIHTLEQNKHLRTTRKVVSMSSNAPKQVKLPGVETAWISVLVTEIVDGNRFWAHYGDRHTIETIMHLLGEINENMGRELERITPGEVRVGDCVLAPYTDVSDEQTLYYRALITNITVPTKPHSQQEVCVEVFFVDYGNKSVVLFPQLRHMPQSLKDKPFQAFECVLSGIKPFYKLPNNQWLPEAKHRLLQLILSRRLEGKVYSVVDSVVRLELFDTEQEPEVNIQQVLIDEEIAESAEEPYVSKVNHMQREMQSELHVHQGETESMDGMNESWPEMEVAPGNAKGVKPKIKKRGKVYLHGPFSPYEMNFSSLTKIGRLKTTRVDRTSVNSIALSTEPEEKHEKMMISAHVGLNPSGTVLQARNTTLMPNIHDLPALVCMLFAPTIELRNDAKKTRLTGALCGLGWDPVEEVAALADHDMEITFDTKITNDDISQINGIRMAINVAVGSKESIDSWGVPAMFKIQRQARAALVNLFMKKRTPVEPVHFPRPYSWNMVDEDDMLYSEVADGIEQSFPKLYQYHNSITLEAEDERDEESEAVTRMRSHLADLHAMASRSTVPFQKPVTCLLCQIICYGPRDLLYHLRNTSHIMEEEKLEPHDLS